MRMVKGAGGIMRPRLMVWSLVWILVLAALAFAAAGGWCRLGIDDDRAVWLCVTQLTLAAGIAAVVWFEQQTVRQGCEKTTPQR
jgi:hypothetical protein